MAHELDMTNGRANMAYVGDVPWHGLGQRLTEGAALDVWCREAGMDWECLSSELRFNSGNKKKEAWMPFPDRVALYRSDTKAPLAVVSDGFQVVQPREVIHFFADLVEAHGFSLETAGCLFGGRKFWALARTAKNVRIMGQDEIAPYLLLATACDGSMATCGHLTSVRVVCNNTLRMSIGADGSRAKVRVVHSAKFDAKDCKRQLGVIEESWDSFIDNITKLAKLKLARDEAIDIVAQELKDEWLTDQGDAMSQEEMLNSSRVLKRIIALYDGEAIGSQLRSSKGTAWGLVNAVTQWCDHESGTDQSRTFERAHLTDRAAMKVRVANKLLAAA